MFKIMYKSGINMLQTCMFKSNCETLPTRGDITIRTFNGPYNFSQAHKTIYWPKHESITFVFVRHMYITGNIIMDAVYLQTLLSCTLNIKQKHVQRSIVFSGLCERNVNYSVHRFVDEAFFYSIP